MTSTNMVSECSRYPCASTDSQNCHVWEAILWPAKHNQACWKRSSLEFSYLFCCERTRSHHSWALTLEVLVSLEAIRKICRKHLEEKMEYEGTRKPNEKFLLLAAKSGHTFIVSAFLGRADVDINVKTGMVRLHFVLLRKMVTKRW